MVCPYCHGKTKIINSRHQTRNNSTWRRRQCLKCEALITTKEEADYSRLWVLIDKNGRFNPFLQDKLFISLYDSLKHRRTALNDARALLSTVVAKLSKVCPDGQVERQELIDTTLSILTRFDKVATVYYRAYYS